MSSFILTLPLFITFSLLGAISFANSEINIFCEEAGEVNLICQYKGRTGLELFEEIHTHQIHRKPLYTSSGPASVVLIKNARLFGTGYLTCWILVTNEPEIVDLHCGGYSPEKIPDFILKKI